MLNIKEIRQMKGLTQKEVCLALNIPQNTFSQYENNKREPDNETLKEIADFFNVSTDYLLGRDSTPNYKSMFLSEDVTYMEVIGSVKAGYDGLICEEHTGERVPIPTAFFRGGHKEDFFLLKVSGNSMYPKLVDGDIVLVHRTSSVDSGTIAVLLYDGEDVTVKTVKFVYGEDWLDLIPTNPEYETKRIEGFELEKCRVLGKVVKLIRDL